MTEYVTNPKVNFFISYKFYSKPNEDPALQTAFAALKIERQRAYLFHFSQPKTRTSRVEKWLPQILHGKGLDD